jgi:hypothetical protein
MYDSDSSEPSITESELDSEYEPESDSEYETASGSKLDSVVVSVLHKFINRAQFGKEKYGTDLDREDLSFLDWVNHAQEEHMDAILYLEKMRKVEMKRLTENSSHSDTWKIMLQWMLIMFCTTIWSIIYVRIIR